MDPGAWLSCEKLIVSCRHVFILKRAAHLQCCCEKLVRLEPYAHSLIKFKSYFEHDFCTKSNLCG